MADRRSTKRSGGREVALICDTHLQLNCPMCLLQEHQSLLSRRLEDALSLVNNRHINNTHFTPPGHNISNTDTVYSEVTLPAIGVQHRISLSLLPTLQSTSQTPLALGQSSHLAEQSRASACNYSELPSRDSAVRVTSVPPSTGHTLSQVHNGARPRTSTVRRSLTSPENLCTLSRPSNRTSPAFTLSHSVDDSSALGSTSKRASLLKGLDTLLKATKKRFNKKPKPPVEVTVMWPGPPSTPALTGLEPVSMAVNIPFVIPVMNMGPAEVPRRVVDDVDMLVPMPHIRAHTTVDYLHYLVPGLVKVTNCGFYWGIMDRYEAEALLENKPEGTFLLRDSSQDDFIFSVSFRRYGRSLHARVEQWNHKFSFDAHDEGMFKATSVTTLIEHYKDSQTCMFFEPMLTRPLNRPNSFSLLHLARAVVCDNINYDSVDHLNIPRNLQDYLRYYHYKQKIRVRTHSNSTQLRGPR